MSFKKLRRLVIVGLVLLLPTLQAEAFRVKHISVVGLQRISRATVLQHANVKLNHDFQQSDSTAAISALYKTGFFSNISFDHRGSTLIITLTERPTIGLIFVTGNEAISNKQLKPILKQMNLFAGQTYNPARVSIMKMGLQSEYKKLGYYAVTVSSTAEPKSRNRVALTIHINEGPIAKIKSITIKGNKIFSSRKIIDQMKLKSSGLLSFFNHSDRYSEDKLEKDLQGIQSFYYDQGYLQYKMLNKTVTISADHEVVTIAIDLYEGAQFHISKVSFIGLEAKNPKVIAMNTLRAGDIFSRQDVMDVEKAISVYFKNRGYAMPAIQVKPVLDLKRHQVAMTFSINPGHRVYVRFVSFSGNKKSQDFALRSRARQLEGSIYSQHDIDETKRKLSLLSYFSNVTPSIHPVPGKPDEVDINYNVTEKSSSSLQLNAGYGDLNGFFYGASVNEMNFLGSGKQTSVNFMRGQYQANYGVSYTDPMFTLNGVSQSISFNYSHSTPSKVDLASYDEDDLGLNLNYGIPISEYNTINLGVGYSYINISNVSSKTTPPSIVSFLNDYTSPYNQFDLSLGFTRDTTNRFPFPTSGSTQSISAELGIPIRAGHHGNKYSFLSLGYYKISLTGKWYWPVGAGFIIDPHVDLGYGDGFAGFSRLPFFQNFYAGGVSSLPGFNANSLGPKNPNDHTQYLGGNAKIIAGVNFILPSFISDSVRTAVFFDAGNIFNTHKIAAAYRESLSLKNIRYAAGLMVVWYLPVLNWPLEFSVGFPLNKKAGDDTSVVGFSVGSSL